MAPSTIPSCCLTAEQKDNLIEAVRQRPVIWDCSLPDHQEVQNRRTAFAEVAALLSDGKNEYTGPEMQVEWKKLRDIFNRTLKKVVATASSGDSEVTWRYWQKLQFIADHERSQIFKAMQKWSKKVPQASSSSSSSRRKSSSSYSAQGHLQQQQRALRNNVAGPPPSQHSAVSMVQQLAEVAQTARELLGGIKEEEEQEQEEEEEGEEERGESEPKMDPLGQILLLSSQLGASSQRQHSGSPTMMSELDQHQMENGELPKLLNELLAKSGAMEPEDVDQQQTEQRQQRRTVNGLGHHRPPKRARPMESNNRESGQQQQQNRGGDCWTTGSRDQFDIFGMFIASQVRTLNGQDPPSALRLKRALTELCFKYEAENDTGTMNGVS